MTKNPTCIIYKCINWILIRKENTTKTSYNTFQYNSFPTEKKYKDDLLVESFWAHLFFFFLAEEKQSLKYMTNSATNIYLLKMDKKIHKAINPKEPPQ